MESHFPTVGCHHMEAGISPTQTIRRVGTVCRVVIKAIHLSGSVLRHLCHQWPWVSSLIPVPKKKKPIGGGYGN